MKEEREKEYKGDRPEGKEKAEGKKKEITKEWKVKRK